MTNVASSFDPAALLAAAKSHLDERRWDEAERHCRQVLQRDPDNADALGLLAAALSDGPGSAEAVPTLLRHLELRPDDGGSLHRLGRVRAEQGDAEAAARLLEQAACSLPDVAIIHNDLAVILDRLGRAEQALAAADRAVALDPGFAFAHGNRGLMLFNVRRFDEALDSELKALAALEPGQSQSRAAVMHTLAQAAAKAGRLDEAEAAIRAQVAADDDPLFLGPLAVLLDLQGRRDRKSVV